MDSVRRWLHLIVPFVVLGLALALRVQDPQLVQLARLKVFDLYQQLSPRPYEPTPVRIIDIDDESLERIGQWPWPRTYVAELIARVFNMGAAVVALDAVYAEPDRTSPANVLPLWPETPEIEALRQRIDDLPDHDAILAEVIAQANVVTGFVLTAEAGGRTPAVKWGIASAGDPPMPSIFSYAGAVTNLPEIERAAAGNGSFTLTQDRDLVIRRIELLFVLDDAIYPSLVAETLRVYQGASTYIIKSSGANREPAFGERTGINHVKIGRYEIPTDARGRLWLHDTGHVPERFIPAWKLFEDDFDAAQVAGKILFLGTSAAGLKDIRSTALAPGIAGVEVHAQALEQMLLRHFLERPDWADGLEVVYLLVLGLVLILLLRRFGAFWCAVIGVAGVALAIGASWQLYVNQRWLLDAVAPSAAVLTIYLVGSLFNFLQSEAKRREVRSAFSQYLSPALVDQLAAEPERLRLGGETKEMTILFCDVRDFTAVSEGFKSDPQGLTRLINRLLTPTTDAILRTGGTIDKYMGDCIMAFWNAPLDDEAHADHACQAALAMFVELEALNQRMEAEAEAEDKPFKPLRVGIGLNTGDCVVGNMGSDQRFDYTVLGDAVNLAARLEGQSKSYGVDIVIGEETGTRVDGYATLELDLIRVKGKTEAVRIHALLGGPEVRMSEPFQRLAPRHAEMLAAYRAQDWARARRLIAECRPLDGALSGLFDLYDERIDAFEREPPGADWDGVFVAVTK